MFSPTELIRSVPSNAPAKGVSVAKVGRGKIMIDMSDVKRLPLGTILVKETAYNCF